MTDMTPAAAAAAWLASDAAYDAACDAACDAAAYDAAAAWLAADAAYDRRVEAWAALIDAVWTDDPAAIRAAAGAIWEADRPTETTERRFDWHDCEARAAEDAAWTAIRDAAAAS